MAVLLPNRSLSVQRAGTHPWDRDAYGQPVPPDPATVTAPAGPALPGAATEQPDGSWTLRLDPSQWPVRPGDRITDGTLTWVLSGAWLRAVPVDSGADYIQANGVLDPPKAV
ncbi:hypothetical protein [Actinacidiphila sp. bgisy160]|uniref:hypothetical protein n=1 Tax=Actinacidiphila sp. bgisy160 TaxID=3413796 RepID=UPI003D71FF34